MRTVTRNWLAIGVGLLVALAIINAAVAYYNTNHLRETGNWVAHTHEVNEALESLISSAKDAETGNRGFILTGSEEYLEPYHAARAESGKTIERLQALTTDNKQQQAEIPRLKQLITERLDVLQDGIKLRREQGFDAAQRLIDSDSGKRSMDSLRALVDTMKSREQFLLEHRQAEDQAAYRSAMAMIVASLATSLVGVLLFLWLLQKHLKHVTEAAAEIHEQRELLRATLVSIGDGVIATDTAGLVTFLNDVAQKLTGWSDADAKGMSLERVFNIVNEETRQKVGNPAFRALSDGKIVGLANHTILIGRNGVEWPIDDSAAPIKNEAGQVRGAILVFREISERKLQEQELRRQALALAEADQRKDEFLAMLAHELRNPLAPISNAMQLWPFVENDKSELENLRAMIERQLQMLIRLIDDLLDISRITRGKIELRKQEVDLATIVASVVETVQPMVDSCGHKLTLTIPARPVYIEGDVARLNQVFGNILNNAIKHVGRNGVIWVEVNENAVVRIRDNGPGIPQHMLTAIFELFRQVDATLTRASGGLGIGLTLAKRLVEAHGGTIEAKSDGPGQGAEFVITLPTIQGAAPAERPRFSMRQLSGHPARRIAVVDDVDASAQTLGMMLRAVGHDVTTFNDGPTAIAWTLKNSPEVMFLDIAMPGMSGYDVARELRAQRPNLVLVALTGYGQDDDRRRAFEAGFNHHMVKPATLEALENVLSNPIPQASN